MTESTGANEDVPAFVQSRSTELFDEAQSLLGGRLAECSFDPDGNPRITVIDLNDADIAGLQNIAARLNIGEWVRIECADPALLQAWKRLGRDLLKLRRQHPTAFQQYPTPGSGYQRPPVRIRLAANASVVAAQLDDSYGDFVSLQVGAMPYPLDPSYKRAANAQPALKPIEADELLIELDGSLSIPSGQTATHGLLLLNRSDHPISVATNGTLTADIIDPRTATIVGGFSGWQHAPSIVFTVQPGRRLRIPLVVGTASFKPELGYAISPGLWHLTAPMELQDGRHVVTPPMEFTVTA